MGTNCAPLVADLFLFCYERDFMKSLTKKYDMIDSFNSTSRYLDDLLNVDIIHFEQMVRKNYDKRDDFDIVNFPFLDCDVPRRPSYNVYIFQLIRFARASSHVNRNKFLTGKLLKQGYRYHKPRNTFSKCYGSHFDLIEKYNVSLKKRMQQGI